jgi:hypothetical protein
MELEVQQCPPVRTKLLATGTYFWRHFEQTVVNLQNDSDNNSCSSSEEVEEEVAEEDDGELSGIEAL